MHVRAFLYGKRRAPVPDGHPSLGFERPTELVFAEDRRDALRVIDPALKFSDPDRYYLILHDSHPEWCLLDYPTFDGWGEEKRRMERDAVFYLQAFGWHYPDQEFCDLCEFWQDFVCRTCGLCPSCKIVARQDCTKCGPVTE